LATTDGEPRVTLRGWIDDNHRLLSALGILVFLSIFASTLRPRELALWLGSVLLGMSVLVVLELWAVFPRRRAASQLQWFGLGILVALFLLALHLLSRHHGVPRSAVFMLVWAALLSVAVVLINRAGAKRRGGEGIRLALIIAAALGLLCLSAYLERLVVPPVFRAVSALLRSL